MKPMVAGLALRQRAAVPRANEESVEMNPKDRDADDSLLPVAHVGDSSTERDVCGEALLDELCQDSSPVADRYEGQGLRGGGPPEEVCAPAPEYGSLDHPHVEPHCPFCAIRQQQPSRHRVRCAIFFTGECDCGGQRR